MYQSTFADSLAELAIFIPTLLVSVSFHEFSHALVATLFGDKTPQKAGRLTLNPLVHVDLWGLLFLLFFKFGWAKPVTFDSRAFKYPRFFSILVALAGPLSNFILAIVGMVILKYLPAASFSVPVGRTFEQLLGALVGLNISLGLFNLIPLPPLDGSHIFSAFLSKRFMQESKFADFVHFLYQYAFFILVLLFMLPPVRIAFAHAFAATYNFFNFLIN